MTPIESLLDLASRIEDFPEDVSGRDAVKTIRAATEALEVRLAEAERLLNLLAKTPTSFAFAPIQHEAMKWLTDSAEPVRAKRLTDAGYPKRDNRLECDGCGKLFTPQLLPAHKCEADGPSETVADGAK